MACHMRQSHMTGEFESLAQSAQYLEYSLPYEDNSPTIEGKSKWLILTQ